MITRRRLAALALGFSLPSAIRASWIPPSGLPAAWIPSGGVGAGGLGMVACHCGATYPATGQWVNNLINPATGLAAPIKVVSVFSYIFAGYPAAGGTVYLNLEQPASAADHENFYVHETDVISWKQDYPAPGIVCNPGDALVFGIAGPSSVGAALKALFTF